MKEAFGLLPTAASRRQRPLWRRKLSLFLSSFDHGLQGYRQWDGKHSGNGVKVRFASNHSRVELPTTCGAFASTRRSRSLVSAPGSDADLAWETELLQYLDREGMTVPVPIPTTDGRLFVDGLVVMKYMEGGPPETESDWRRVADTLRELHRLTQGWPQRPGWRSSTDLLHTETGTRINLTAMPPESVVRCRAAWARLIGRQTCVVHGNPNSPANVRMTADRVALIDWDETHVDVPDLDWCCPTTPPISTTARMTSPRKRQPHGKPPSAGRTSTQSNGLPKFERSEQFWRIDGRHPPVNFAIASGTCAGDRRVFRLSRAAPIPCFVSVRGMAD